MTHIPALVAVLLQPAIPPLLLGTPVSAEVLLLAQVPDQAQTTEAVAKTAEAITVRIEGATSGSGVLVKRDGKRYTVLTAWHVVEGQRPGEELAIFTSDGQGHQLDPGTIQRLGKIDLAVLTFSSPKTYELAQIGDVKSVSSGSLIFVSGFPLPTKAIPTRIRRLLRGDVIANASVAIPNGYQLLYSNPTLPGMSGGAVLNSQGQLVGIHASAERADQISESTGKAVATGTNQAVPIGYYNQWVTGAANVTSSSQAATDEDYLVQAKQLIGKKGQEQEHIRLSNQALSLRPSANGYAYRGYTKGVLNDYQGAISDFNQALAINPRDADVYNNRGSIKLATGDKQGAIADYNQALAINPRYVESYNNRGWVKAELGDYQGSIADFNQALAINPRHADSYNNRGIVKSILGDKQGAIDDYGQALAINPRFAGAYNSRGAARSGLGDKQGAITDYNQAIAINPRYAYAYVSRGNSRYGLGDKQGAIADYNQALAISPQIAQAYIARGDAKFALGDRDGACLDYKKGSALGDQSKSQWLQSDKGAWCRRMQ
jgi:tetratricopeptide (TPR) repeat protein